MIALIAWVLVTTTYEGKVSVSPGLTEHECRAAACVARYGKSCDEHEVEEKSAYARFLKYCRMYVYEAGKRTVKPCAYKGPVIVPRLSAECAQ